MVMTFPFCGSDGKVLQMTLNAQYHQQLVPGTIFVKLWPSSTG